MFGVAVSKHSRIKHRRNLNQFLIENVLHFLKINKRKNECQQQ